MGNNGKLSEVFKSARPDAGRRMKGETMSWLDRKRNEGNKPSAAIFPKGSALLPVTRQKIDNLREKLKQDKLTPWRWFKSLGVTITDFYGKTIAMSGVYYEGSPALVFWKFIEPFLRDAIVNTLQETFVICLDRKWAAEPYIRETATLLDGHLICPIYQEMVGIDRHLRGKGNPESVRRRDVSEEVADMRRFLNNCKDEMILGIREENVKARAIGGKGDLADKLDYLEIKPGVFGIKVNIINILKDLITHFRSCM
jgi:hypothetical protein